jgi:hypothetical protein
MALQYVGSDHRSELELGGVEGVGLPAFGDDILLFEHFASLAGDADGDGPLIGLGASILQMAPQECFRD